MTSEIFNGNPTGSCKLPPRCMHHMHVRTHYIDYDRRSSDANIFHA